MRHGSIVSNGTANGIGYERKAVRHVDTGSELGRHFAESQRRPKAKIGIQRNIRRPVAFTFGAKHFFLEHAVEVDGGFVRDLIVPTLWVFRADGFVHPLLNGLRTGRGTNDADDQGIGAKLLVVERQPVQLEAQRSGVRHIVHDQFGGRPRCRCDDTGRVRSNPASGGRISSSGGPAPPASHGPVCCAIGSRIRS